MSLAARDSVTEASVLELLDWYDDAFPQGTFKEASAALTGQKPLGEMADACERSLEMGQAEDDPAERSALEKTLTLLRGLDGKQVHTSNMRQYDVKKGSPQEINDRAAEGGDAFSLLAHDAALTATADFAVYDLGEGEYAVCINTRQSTPGAFEVQIGCWKGGLDIHITDDVDACLHNNYYTDCWRRAGHLTEDGDPWVFAAPSN